MECERLMALARRKGLHASTVDPRGEGRSGPTSLGYRSSQTAWLEASPEDGLDLLASIDARIRNATGYSLESAEDYQIATYKGAQGPGGAEYKPHVDFASKSGTERGGNRLATVMIYLAAPDIGGFTVFTELNVSVAPEVGSAVVWRNLKGGRGGAGDYRTRHGACPVLRGEKWIANKWIHEDGN